MSRVDPRHVYVLSFDTANTDLAYICSHDDIVLNGVTSPNVFYGDIVEASTVSQSINPIKAQADLGSIDFGFNDDSKNLTGLINSKILAGKGTLAKRVQHWTGEKGQEWPGQYKLSQTQQMYDAIRQTLDGVLWFSARDIQRSTLTDIFDTKKTNLTASITQSDTTINVTATTGFALLQHGPSYSDAPNDEVVYIQIEKEAMRCTAIGAGSFTVDNEASTINGAISVGATTVNVTDASAFRTAGHGRITTGTDISEIRWTGKTGNQLTGVTGVIFAHTDSSVIVDAQGRGVLNTVAVEHVVDSGITDDARKPVVEEYIYYELPVIKFALAIFGGTLYGSADTLPAHHTLSIPAAWINTSQFTNIGADLWDPSDDTKGIVFPFEGLTKQNAFKFVNEQLNFFCHVFNPILPTGELGLQQFTGVLSDAAYTRIWTEDDIADISNIRYDLDDIHNVYELNWDYDPVNKIFNRPIRLVSLDSTAIHGETKALKFSSLGLKGARHTDAVINMLFNMWKDRHVGPPFKAAVTADYRHRDVKVGEIVRLRLQNLTEPTDQDGDFETLDLSVEIQSIRIDHNSGDVVCDVFGSTYKSAPLNLGNAATALDDTFYTGSGSILASHVTGSEAGGILTITGNSSLTGVDDLDSATASADNGQGRFYYDGDVVVNPGVIVTISKNVELRINGFLTWNGDVNGKGQGLAGGTNGQAGYLGNTQAGGSVDGTVVDKRFVSSAAGLIQGQSHGINGGFALINNSGNLEGRPNNLMGSSGGKGGDVTDLDGTVYAGAQGANGGAGLAIVCKGASGGASTVIDLSGNDGLTGALVETQAPFANKVFRSSGAGGEPGGLWIGLDGNSVTETLSAKLVANVGITPVLGTPFENEIQPFNFIQPGYSFYTGLHNTAENRNLSNRVTQWIPDNETPSQPSTPDAGVTLNSVLSDESVLQLTSEGTLTTRALLSWTATDLDFVEQYQIEYKLTSDSNWLSAPTVNDRNATQSYIPGLLDGTEYDFRIRALSKFGLFSEWSTISNHNVIGKKSLPPDLSTFTVTRQPDGTREFAWTAGTLPADVRVGGSFKIKYKNGSGGTWATMSDFPGAENLPPGIRKFETNQLAAGSYTFGIKMLDSGGRESENAIIIEISLGDPRISEAFEVTDLDELGWPGTKTNCYVDEYNQLVASDQNDWSDLGSPNDWGDWTAFPQNPFLSITYEHTKYDIGTIVSLTPLVTILHNGDSITIEEQHSDNDVSYSSWAAVGPLITARYFKIRFTITRSSGLIIVSGGDIVLSGSPVSEILEDIDTSALAACSPSPSCSTSGYRIAAGDVRLPITKTYAKIRRVFLTLQNVGSGWTWELIDKDTSVGPRVKIYNSSGTLADASIDAEIQGL